MALSNRVYYSTAHPAKRWWARAEATPLIMRRALGACVKELLAERKKIMRETIYQRGRQFAGRFSFTLMKSEQPFFAGNRAGVVNNAKSKRGYKYAAKRHDMRGYSKRLQTRKESFWALKAERGTRPRRERIIRQAKTEIQRVGQ